MDFLRARTKEQIDQRRFDIIQACAKLFDEGGYDFVNLKSISEMTAISRPSIYTYYKTKDEIMLDILIMKLTEWKNDLLIWTQKKAPLSKETFCREFTDILSKHDSMLNYYSLLYTMLERNCRLEKLIDFKQQVIPLLETFVQVILTHFPNYSVQQAAFLAEEILAYILGIYPTTHLTDKQQEALIQSNMNYHAPDFKTLCESGLLAFFSL